LSWGASVIGIDAGDVGGQAAGRNGGFLLSGPEKGYHHAVEAYGRERARSYTLSTQAEIDRIVAADPSAVRPTGSLRIATAEGELEDLLREVEARQADGFEVEPYDGPEGCGFLVPGDAAMNPLLRCRCVAGRLRSTGAQLYAHTPALSIHPGEVRTPSGRIRANHTVVAIDGRLEALFPEFAGRSRTARIQMLGTAPTWEVSFPRPVYAEWGYVFWQQTPNGRVAIGGHRNLDEAAEWTHEPGTSARVQDALEATLRSLGVTAPVTHRWSGHSAYTPDGRPILEEVRNRVFAVGGYSGHGNVTGALYAREATRLALTGLRTEALLDA